MEIRLELELNDLLELYASCNHNSFYSVKLGAPLKPIFNNLLRETVGGETPTDVWKEQKSVEKKA